MLWAATQVLPAAARTSHGPAPPLEPALDEAPLPELAALVVLLEGAALAELAVPPELAGAPELAELSKELEGAEELALPEDTAPPSGRSELLGEPPPVELFPAPVPLELPLVPDMELKLAPALDAEPPVVPDV